MRFTSSVLTVGAILLLWASPALAQEAVEVANSWAVPAVGIGLALAAMAGVWSQAKVVSTALDSIGRNPGAAGEMFVPMLLGLALIESLVVFVLVFAFMVS